MRYALILGMFVICSLYGAPTFISGPSLKDSAGLKWVSFSLNEATDVEVAVVNKANSTIIRHLTAGMLGANPPAPLAPNTLNQVLAWDGKDDLGRTVSVNQSDIGVRVRAGLSVRLEQFVGGDKPHLFTPYDAIFEPSGKTQVVRNGSALYIYGNTAVNGPWSFRKYDLQGNYERTLFPYPASLSATEVVGFGVNTWSAGGFSPQYAANHLGYVYATISPKAVSYAFSILPLSHGRFLFMNDKFSAAVVKASGAIENIPFPLITSPTLPSLAGQRFLSLSHDTNFVYLSGVFQSNAQGAVDTGFWKDGRIFKVNLKTGSAQAWLTLDSVPLSWSARTASIGHDNQAWNTNPDAAIHGLALDNAGRVFVCDRLHSRIAVYDTGAAFLGAIGNVPFPERVELDSATGAVYVLTHVMNGYWSGDMSLRKYSGWGPAASLVWAKSITTSIASKPTFTVVQAGGKPMIWIGYTFGVRVYRDDGNSLSLFQDYGAANAEWNDLAFERIAIDRRNETVYIQNSKDGVYKIENWDAPVIRPCSTSQKQRLTGQDLAISFDNQMYLFEGSDWYRTPISRYSLDHYHDSIPFPNTGKNTLGRGFYTRADGNNGNGRPGLAIAPDKRVAVMGELGGWANYHVFVFADSGRNDSLSRADSVVSPLGPRGYIGCGGVKFDLKGNLYIGVAYDGGHPPGYQIPPGFSGDWASSNYTGEVLRFPPGAKGSVSGTPYAAVGQDKVYTPGFAPLTGTRGDCMCRNARFDVDLYGRLFIPNGYANQVAITDNNDNLILKFGQYGNADSRGPGSLIPAPDIPLGWPVAVAASDNYIYVNDALNNRLARIKMEHVLDNMPGTSLDNGPAHGGAVLRMTATPNPFNASIVISLHGINGKFRGKLEVFNIKGEKVADLARSPGDTGFRWNAGKRPSGTYIARITIGGRTLSRRIALLR